MAWDMLKATGKLVKDLVSIEVESVVDLISRTHTDRKIAERLKPHLRRIEPESQSWYKMKIGLSEEQVGKLLGLPDIIDNETKRTAEDVAAIGNPGGVYGVCWDESWWYSSKSVFEYCLDGIVRFENQRVTYFRVYYKKGKRWQAAEAPPNDWIKARQEEINSGELGTIL